MDETQQEPFGPPVTRPVGSAFRGDWRSGVEGGLCLQAWQGRACGPRHRQGEARIRRERGVSGQRLVLQRAPLCRQLDPNTPKLEKTTRAQRECR